MVNAWDVLRKAGRNTLKLDPIVLAKVSKILEKPGIDDFVKTIKNPLSSNPKFNSPDEFVEAFARKHTEAPGGQLSFELELDNLDNFIDQYKSFSGAGEYLEEMVQSGAKFKGGSYGLDLLKNKLDDLTENGKYAIDGFEGGIDEVVSGHRYDFRLKSIEDPSVFKNVETKNWSEARAITGSTYDQFKAYFQSGRLFEYRFKSLATEMKVEFQSLFSSFSKVDELWELNPTFFTSQGFVSKQEVVNDAVAGNLINSPILNFVKQ